MKYILILAGLILVLNAVFPLFEYGFYFLKITEYGKGYVIGKLIILSVGLILMGFGLTRLIKSYNN